MSPLVFGIVAGLTCAASWAVASIAFGAILQRSAAPPVSLSFLKGAISVPPMLVMVALTGGFGAAHHGALLLAMAPLAVSSLLGLVIADTAYITALKNLGAARVVFFVPVIPFTSALMAAGILDERLGPLALVGMAVTLIGVLLALWPAHKPTTTTTTTPSTSTGRLTRNQLLFGLLMAVLYVLCQAGSNIIIKQTLTTVSPLPVATARLLLGSLMLLPLLWVDVDGRAGVARMWSPQQRGLVVGATLIGTCGGIWLGTTATHLLPVGAATTLIATTPVWALAIERVRGRAAPARALLGGLLVVAGVALLATSLRTATTTTTMAATSR